MVGAETETEAELLTPADFLPQSSSALKDFYRYEGSLTTPMCNEVVVWTVFAAPVEVSADQVRCWRVLICTILHQLQIFTSSSRYSHNFYHTGNFPRSWRSSDSSSTRAEECRVRWLTTSGQYSLSTVAQLNAAQASRALSGFRLAPSHFYYWLSCSLSSKASKKNIKEKEQLPEQQTVKFFSSLFIVRITLLHVNTLVSIASS